LKLLLTGDYFYDYEDSQEDFNKIKKEFNSVDISILNYEGSFESSEVRKKSVNLSMSNESLNFDNNMLFCLANNHILDYDVDGCVKTISSITYNGLDCFGLESSKNKFDNYKLIEKDGIIICIGSFGWLNEECISSSKNKQGNVNLTKKNIELFFDSIKDLEYDKLLIYTHYGYEYEYYPLPLHVDLFRYMIDLGADFIYSSHSHILQPYEIYNDKYIFYGLGNFYFASRRDIYPESSDLGLYLELDISKYCIKVYPKYIQYNRKLKQSTVLLECNYFDKHKLDILSFDRYSKEYSKTRIRKKNPRPILYRDSDFINSIKFKGWKLIVDITGFLKIRQLVKKILGW
jgi:hypothetical protein